MMNASNQIKPVRQIYAVDLFCGAGGLTRGLPDAGITVRVRGKNGGAVDLQVTNERGYNNEA